MIHFSREQFTAAFWLPCTKQVHLKHSRGFSLFNSCITKKSFTKIMQINYLYLLWHVKTFQEALQKQSTQKKALTFNPARRKLPVNTTKKATRTSCSNWKWWYWFHKKKKKKKKKKKIDLAFHQVKEEL